jgi:GTP-binding protein EngB required for normal cell division
MASGTISEEGDLDATTPPNPTDVVALASELAARYQITSLEPLLRVCGSAALQKELSVAVLGRFKAGKSSFLNQLIGRDLLPVGVVPVTSVITEILWGPEEKAQVHFLGGRDESVPVGAIAEFITESNNPENEKRVNTVTIHTPELREFKGLRFIDTPGLESALTHNTEASLAWVPNVDIALVAVGVDPPLSHRDVVLIHKLFEYTPKVCVLLTKVDLITEDERQEVFEFVRTQLNRNFEQRIEVFPYSTRLGFESLRAAVKDQLFHPTLATVREQKRDILNHKLQTLLRECGDYLQLMLRSAEMIDAERQQLRTRAAGEKESLSDTKQELQLIARHNIGVARSHIEKTLAPYEKPIQLNLANALEQEYPTWKKSFARLLEQFERWLHRELTCRLKDLSASHKTEFLKPLRDVQRQYLRVLQAFRDRISQRTMELFGVPLRTTETQIEPKAPDAPDIDIGRMFDHSWELLSPMIPMVAFRGAVKARFLNKVDYETFKNLSRLATQWTDIVAAAIHDMQREAEHRLEELIKTIDRLTASSTARAPEIRSDLGRVRQAQANLQGREYPFFLNKERL